MDTIAAEKSRKEQELIRRKISEVHNIAENAPLSAKNRKALQRLKSTI